MEPFDARQGRALDAAVAAGVLSEDDADGIRRGRGTPVEADGIEGILWDAAYEPDRDEIQVVVAVDDNTHTFVLGPDEAGGYVVDGRHHATFAQAWQDGVEECLAAGAEGLEEL